MVLSRAEPERRARRRSSVEGIVPEKKGSVPLPKRRMAEDLLVELAITLYAQETLSFGKARELVAMSKYEFGQLCGLGEWRWQDI